MANDNYNNFFSDALKQWESFSSQAPGVDFNEITSASRKSLEAFAAANQAIAEGYQQVARRQVELVQQNAEQAIDLFKEVISAKDPRDGASKQIAFAEKSLKKAAQDANELAELTSKTNSKAADIISKQVTEGIKEFSNIAASANSNKKKSAA